LWSKHINLELISSKRRDWLGPVFIILAFVLFIPSGVISIPVIILLDLRESLFAPFLFFSFFFVILYFLKKFLSKHKFISDGVLHFNEEMLYSSGARKEITYKWEKIRSIRFEYKGDRSWNSTKWEFWYVSGKRRYNTLVSGGHQFHGNEPLDAIIINGNIFFVKIRNAFEKKLFFDLANLASEKVEKTQILEFEIESPKEQFSNMFIR
jgi:hypothetical protein